MNRYIIGLDIGGTSIKSSIIDINNPNNKYCQNFFTSFTSNAISLSCDDTIQRFTSIFDHMYSTANTHNLTICGIGIATPGPFDHEKGISLMQHKYKFLYGINLQSEFRKYFSKIAEFPIIFDDDCRAFLLGEALYGEASGFSRCIGITIGTGLGAGFLVDNNFLREGHGVPSKGQIWSLPYEDGIVEDIVSKHGIIKIYNTITSRDNSEIEVEDIAKLALSGDYQAREAFMELGRTLGKVLRPIVREFEAECLIFGGNISRSFLLFAKALQEELETLPHLRKIAQAMSIDLSVFYGLAYKFKKLEEKAL